MKLPKIECSTALMNLVAFLAVLISIVVLSLAGHNDLAVVTGLVGVLGSFRPWSTKQDDKKGGD